MDKLVKCKHCGSKICYEQTITEDVNTWLCVSCGFTTSTVMVENSPADSHALATSPELYKDLRFVDEDKRVWYPATITVPNVGMVFVDGTSASDYKWAAVRAVELATEEKKSKRFPKDQTHKIDMSKAVYFEQVNFVSALEHIGLLQ